MSAVFVFLKKMFFFAVPTFPIYLFFRFCFLYRKKEKVNFYREIVLLFFTLFVIALLSQTVLPQFSISDGRIVLSQNREHVTNLIPFRVIPETIHEVFNEGNTAYFLINFLGNIVMFLPFGFFLPLLWGINGRWAILSGLFFSLFVECIQLFLSRGTDVDDLILNTTGAAFGYFIFRLVAKKCNRLALRFR